MSAIYAESSAVLRWLLGQQDAAVVKEVLASAGSVITSSLTPAEIGRTLHRLAATGHLSAHGRRDVWAVFAKASSHWQIRTCSDDILANVAEGFPVEPLRTLDAIHLATAASYSREVQPVKVLTTDAHLRANAQALGFDVVPIVEQ